MGVRGRPVAWNNWYSTERWARIRRIAEEHERVVDLLEKAFGDVVGDLWADFREELRRTIKLAFLERPGLVPRVMGTWREGERYEPLDVVAKDGGLFMCKHSNPGQCPGDDWQLMATRGKRGEPGPIGLRGDLSEWTNL